MITITAEYLESQGLSQSFPERFWSKVEKTEACWIWTGGIDSGGYGSIFRGLGPKRAIRSHVASWILNNGEVPEGLFVLHNCPLRDNPRCVNPAHLYLGTQAANVRDMIFKNTMERGENRSNHKLTWRAVEAIRNSTLTQTVLAKQFGVNQSIISDVIHFKRWRRP